MTFTEEERKLIGDSILYSLSVGQAAFSDRCQILVDLYTKVTGKIPMVSIVTYQDGRQFVQMARERPGA